MTINNKNINNVFYIFVTAHLIFWTLIPSITNHNLPLDTIEALAWGSNLDWGFNKHPPMSAFFPQVFYLIFGPQDWTYYLLSQIFVIISFYYVSVFTGHMRCSGDIVHCQRKGAAGEGQFRGCHHRAKSPPPARSNTLLFVAFAPLFGNMKQYD